MSFRILEHPTAKHLQGTRDAHTKHNLLIECFKATSPFKIYRRSKTVLDFSKESADGHENFGFILQSKVTNHDTWHKGTALRWGS